MKRTIFVAWRFFAGLTRPSRIANARGLRQRGETVASLSIREATPADIPALARLHVTTWNATYAPLLMKGPTYEVREWQWREAFAKNDGSWFCFVVERPDGELVGFAKGKRSDHPEFAGELNKIYLLREYQRLGLGRRLLAHVAYRFLSQGVSSMWLFGDARNPSSRIWTALGAEKTDDDPGNGNYGWRDLRKLVALCESLRDVSGRGTDDAGHSAGADADPPAGDGFDRSRAHRRSASSLEGPDARMRVPSCITRSSVIRPSAAVRSPAPS
jgi:GNAT superfamily N-acetyltransferase